MNKLSAPSLKVPGTDSTLRHVFYALSRPVSCHGISARPRYLHVRAGSRVCCQALINFRVNALLLLRSIFWRKVHLYL